MRIGLDIRYLSHGLTGGIHTYLSRLLPALLAQAEGHELLLYADTKARCELGELPPWARLRLLPYGGPHSSLLHDLRSLRRAAVADRLDLLHFPANYGFAPRGVRSVVTLHDAINLLPLPEIIRGHRKDARTLAMMSYLHLVTRAALRRADLLLAVSEHARGEIGRVGRFDTERIVVAPHGPPPDARRVETPATLDAVRARYGLERPFVLADGLKNPGVLLRAWALLPPELRAGHQLLFFARREPPPVAREAEAAGSARVLLNPPRADLIALYSMASAFVFPSWIEGFGIPLLEAMGCGAPVIASDRGAIPEVLGEAGLLANAEDAPAFARHLTQLLGDRQIAATLRARGYARAAEFSWEITARRTLEAYELAARHSRLTAPLALGRPRQSR
jgi:glycosyltransferase involved in cell wall biosynthesis